MNDGVNTVLFNQGPQGRISDIHGMHDVFWKPTATDTIDTHAVNALFDKPVHHSFADMAFGTRNQDHCCLPFSVMARGAHSRERMHADGLPDVDLQLP
jgi:hypothetical protein